MNNLRKHLADCRADFKLELELGKKSTAISNDFQEKIGEKNLADRQVDYGLCALLAPNQPHASDLDDFSYYGGG